MPEAEVVKFYQRQQIGYDFPLNRICIGFGYKDRDSIQMRLEEGGDVYLSDDRSSRPFGQDRILSATVPFEVLAEEWPRFVEFLRSKAAELKEAKTTKDTET